MTATSTDRSNDADCDLPPTLQARLKRCMGPHGLESRGLVEGRHQGPRQKLQGWQMVAGLAAQCLHPCGSLQHIMRRYFAVRVSSSALSQRRTHMQLEPFTTVMRHALRPLARRPQHPACFFNGLRLVGIDGTQFDLPNTPQINTEVAKVSTRRGPAGFAKLSASVLVELGTHAPLGVAMAFGALNEKALVEQLWEWLPQQSLLLVDRYYGQGPMLRELQRQCESRESHFLVRVRDRLNVKIQRPCGDGSAEVAVVLRESVPEPVGQTGMEAPLGEAVKARGRPRKHPRQKVSQRVVREVRGQVRRGNGQWTQVRLWTSLSAQQAGAAQLLELYARRWEHELFYKELKLQVNQGSLLAGQRTETAAQQVAAMMIACSLLAEERLAIAEASADTEVRQAGAVRISFALCQEYTAALFMVLQASHDLMEKTAQGELVRRVRVQIAEDALPRRRTRSCQRKVRRPVDKWPRMLTPTSSSALQNYAVTSIA